jgi:hypothetical protein
MENLTRDEIDFLVDALQQRWVDAEQKLVFLQRELGNIERKNYEYVKSKSKELMTKLGA